MNTPTPYYEQVIMGFDACAEADKTRTDSPFRSYCGLRAATSAEPVSGHSAECEPRPFVDFPF